MLTIIEDGNDQDHKWWEVKLPYQSKKHKTKLLQQKYLGVRNYLSN
jgi:hypothetical protein